MIRVQVIGAGRVAASFTQGATLLDRRINHQVRRHGQLLATRVRRHASGRPGPRAITGDYRRSWSMQYLSTPADVTAIVGTNAPQGRRLEFGFVGADALGRVYNQPPFPHVGPAVEEQAPLFAFDLEHEVVAFELGEAFK